MKRYCPHCGRAYSGARCPCRPRAKRKPTAGDLTRSEREPWRREYSSAEYQRNRQTAIARTRGRCADCGRVCATFDGKWRTAGLGGEVDHVRALCEGGANDAGNLVLRCKSCHKRRDDMRRRATKQ